MKWTDYLAPLAALAVLALLARRANASVGTVYAPAEYWNWPAAPDAVMADLPSIDASDIMGEADQAAANVAAFLRTIRFAEGTASEQGYNAYFGFHPTRNPDNVVDDLSRHPNIRVPFRDTYSTAAGAYQFINSTWSRVAARLGLSDFSPASQDAAAVELIRQRGALEDVRAGRFADAVYKLGDEWASLPGAGKNQPEKSLSQLLAVYMANGGTTAG